MDARAFRANFPVLERIVYLNAGTDGPIPRVAADAAARGLSDGDQAVVFNDRASITVPVRVGQRGRLGVAVIPFGWWASQHADGRPANALTNDTLTEWGGGVAYSDTLVEVRPD